MILAIVIGVLAVWVLGAIALALLAGGMIKERERHDDRPLGGGRAGERALRRHAMR